METEVLKAMLSEAGIQNYETEVLTHLSDYLDHYIHRIMERSKIYMEHANRKELHVSDVKLALNEANEEEIKSKPAWNVGIFFKNLFSYTEFLFQTLIKLAKEHNKTNLPVPNQKCGIAIPNSALESTNFRMRGLNVNNVVIQLNILLDFFEIDILQPSSFSYQLPSYAALSELIVNSARNPAAVNAILRKLTGNSSMNLNHQQVIYKQQIPLKKGAENTAEDFMFKKRKTI